MRQIDAVAASGSISAPVVGRVGVSFVSPGTESAGVSRFGGVSAFGGVSPFGLLTIVGGVSPVGLVSGVDVHEHVGVGFGVLVLVHLQVGVAAGLLLQEPHVADGDGDGMPPQWQLGCELGMVEPFIPPPPASQLAMATPGAPMPFPHTSTAETELPAVAASALPPPHNATTTTASATTTEAAIDLIGHLCSHIGVFPLRSVITFGRAPPRPVHRERSARYSE